MIPTLLQKKNCPQIARNFRVLSAFLASLGRNLPSILIEREQKLGFRFGFLLKMGFGRNRNFWVLAKPKPKPWFRSITTSNMIFGI